MGRGAGGEGGEGQGCERGEAAAMTSSESVSRPWASAGKVMEFVSLLGREGDGSFGRTDEGA